SSLASEGAGSRSDKRSTASRVSTHLFSSVRSVLYLTQPTKPAGRTAASKSDACRASEGDRIETRTHSSARIQRDGSSPCAATRRGGLTTHRLSEQVLVRLGSADTYVA